MEFIVDQFIDVSKLHHSTRKIISSVQSLTVVIPLTTLKNKRDLNGKTWCLKSINRGFMYPLLVFCDKKIKVPSIVMNRCIPFIIDENDSYKLDSGFSWLSAKTISFSIDSIIQDEVFKSGNEENLDNNEKSDNYLQNISEILRKILTEKNILLIVGMKVFVEYLCQQFILLVTDIDPHFYSDFCEGKCAFRCFDFTKVQVVDTKFHKNETVELLNWESYGGKCNELLSFKEKLSIMFSSEIVKEHHNGVLISGPSGVGKTLIGEILLSMYKEKCIFISSNDLNSNYKGDLESILKRILEKVLAKVPCIVFFDDIDIIGTSRNSGGDTKKVTALLNMFDKINEIDGVLVVSTATKPQDLDTALRRPGRISEDLILKIPNERERISILKVLLSKYQSTSFDTGIEEIATHLGSKTPGFSGSDVQNLLTEATFDSNDNVLGIESFTKALFKVKPLSLKSVASRKSRVSLDDIFGLIEIKENILNAFSATYKHSQIFKDAGITPPSRFLFFGPTGVGKTAMTQAIANLFNLTVITIKRSDVFGKYFGESEKNLAKMFDQADKASPCLLHFQGFESLAGRKSKRSEVSSDVEERIINHLKVLLDGVVTYEKMFIVAETNRPDLLDRDVIRQGRFHHYVNFTLPDTSVRKLLLENAFKDDENLDIEYLVEETEGYSASEIRLLADELKTAWQENHEESMISTDIPKFLIHQVLDSVLPNTSKRMLKRYEEFKSIYCNK